MGHILFGLRGQGYPVPSTWYPYRTVPYHAYHVVRINCTLYSSWHHLGVVSTMVVVGRWSSSLLAFQTHPNLASLDLEAARPL